MVIDLKACKCGEHRFATHEDCFLERRLLERREELALQAMLGMLLWPPVKRRGGGHTGVQSGGDMAAAKQKSINHLGDSSC